VNKLNSVLLFFIVFVFAALILRFTGLINFSGIELLAYLFMISGFSAAYSSFGKDMTGILFIGSTLFLTGILIFVSIHFELEDARQLVFPSVLFITGIGFFLLYIDEFNQKLYLYISLLFLAGGIIYLLLLRAYAFTGFFASVWSMIKIYWPVVVISAGIILLLGKRRSAKTDL
jgi:hypothetical protein